MATISARVNDNIKAEAEKIADEIGIPVSTAINIFLKRFIAERGFPFKVAVPEDTKQKPIIDIDLLDASVKEAIADPNNLGLSHHFTYLDQDTGKPIVISRKEW